MKYFLRNTKSLISDKTVYIHREDGAQFPADEANPDYQKYLLWLNDGNTPEEWTNE